MKYKHQLDNFFDITELLGLPEEKDDEKEIIVNRFDERSAQSFRRALMKRASKSNGFEPIVIRIDSFGGDIYALSKMIEAMDEVSNPLITVCEGKAMSAGAILLSHGDVRFAGYHSSIMIHEVSHGIRGHLEDTMNEMEEIKRLNEHFLGLLAKNCGIKGGYNGLKTMFKEAGVRNMHLTPKKAVEFGLVDYEGVPMINRSVEYEISVSTPVSGFEQEKRIDEDDLSKPRRTKKRKAKRAAKVTKKSAD